MNIDYSKTNDYLIGIDSDGCAFDTMELKHKECFIPNIIHHWGLKGVSKYAREAAEFVNLYSKTRGVNRFPALIEVFRLLNKRPEVVARGVKIEIPQVLVDWIGQESKLGNPALTKYVEQTHDPLMEKALRWSIEVNETIDKVVGEGVPPFPKVRESLQKVQGKADVLVVSQTPQAALNKEWANQGLAQYIKAICGQEVGTKKECLELAKEYPANHTLMVGDAPGDYNAAVANGALFFPINPGEEEASWERFYAEGVDKFLDGTFAGEYQKELLEEFDSHLPVLPPWKQLD
ncbi:MAG: HAD hydrolase-like protein [Thermoguttaceae bacterium]|nr:HAD hydrolase-like protein [Thermoguttaceae bacterium]MBQ2555741.1 HAD hydrolase-like protein [Thermoguttaceae bacterium]MBQ4080450.1 HAD hydrolase-like protein [Thermoguttaceae bacterium]MBQ4195532.1 HAD hydrolase-like protein [Thermoguttaceae bacterium]MBQ5367733.1 HAD hydrolase-like protein [Thermoguttaceae bacterium]